MQTFSIFMPQHCQGFFVHTWTKSFRRNLTTTLQRGSDRLPHFSLTFESSFWWNGAFREAYPLFSWSWLLSKEATLISALGGSVASFRLASLTALLHPLPLRIKWCPDSLFPVSCTTFSFLDSTSSLLMTNSITISIGLKLVCKISNFITSQSFSRGFKPPWKLQPIVWLATAMGDNKAI